MGASGAGCDDAEEAGEAPADGLGGDGAGDAAVGGGSGSGSVVVVVVVADVVVDVLDVVVAAYLWLAVELPLLPQPALATATKATNVTSRFIRPPIRRSPTPPPRRHRRLGSARPLRGASAKLSGPAGAATGERPPPPPAPTRRLPAWALVPPGAVPSLHGMQGIEVRQVSRSASLWPEHPRTDLMTPSQKSTN
jgi:hypothetical protein